MTTRAFYQKLAGQKHITTRAAAQLSGMSVPAASMALRRLAADGLSVPLKKGAWLVGASTSKPGALITAAADPYVAYLSGPSALRLHGRIQQIPQTHFAVTLGRPRDVVMTVGRVTLHHINARLFGGYDYEARADGFVASPEKALFDIAYLATMNHSRVSGNLPETNLKGLRWKEIHHWLDRIATPRIRNAVRQALASIRQRNSESAD
jgi:predicted transcriptional regulator of viral defense system